MMSKNLSELDDGPSTWMAVKRSSWPEMHEDKRDITEQHIEPRYKIDKNSKFVMNISVGYQVLINLQCRMSSLS